MKKKGHLIFIITAAMFLIISCNSQQAKDQTGANPSAFDMKQARAFIDSINAKFEEEIRNHDSVALASHYAPDAEILLDNSEPIKGKDILAAWGSMVGDGQNDWSFTTTDLQGNADFLIETGNYEIRDGNKKLTSRGKYVVVWKKQDNGEWKLYRDIGTSSPMRSN